MLYLRSLLFLLMAVPALAGMVSTYVDAFEYRSVYPPGFSDTLTLTSYFRGFESFGVPGRLVAVRMYIEGGAGESASEVVCQDMEISVAGRLPVFSGYDCGAESDSGPLGGYREFTRTWELALFQPSRVSLVSTWNISAYLEEPGYAYLHNGFTAYIDYEYGPVPEPSQLWLVGLALTALWLCRRKVFARG